MIYWKRAQLQPMGRAREKKLCMVISGPNRKPQYSNVTNATFCQPLKEGGIETVIKPLIQN